MIKFNVVTKEYELYDTNGKIRAWSWSLKSLRSRACDLVDINPLLEKARNFKECRGPLSIIKSTEYHAHG